MPNTNSISCNRMLESLQSCTPLEALGAVHLLHSRDRAGGQMQLAPFNAAAPLGGVKNCRAANHFGESRLLRVTPFTRHPLALLVTGRASFSHFNVVPPFSPGAKRFAKKTKMVKPRLGFILFLPGSLETLPGSYHVSMRLPLENGFV